MWKKRLHLTAAMFALITGMLVMGAVLFYPFVPAYADMRAVEGRTLPFSLNIFQQGAQFFNQLFAKDKTVLDMRYYEMLLGLYFLFALYLFVSFAAGQLQRGRYLAALLSVFIFCDAAYLNWFRSFSPEGVIYPSLILMISCILLLSQKRFNRFVLLSGAAVSGMMMVMAAPDKGFLWCAAGGGFLCLAAKGLRKKDRRLLHRLQGRGGKVFTGAAGILAAVFFAGAVLFQIYGGEDGIIDKYHTMTRGVMSSADNPEEAVRFFGIDSSFSILDGTSAYERYPVIKADDELLYRDFYSHYNTGSILLYYLIHPGSFLYMLESAASQGYVIDSAAVTDNGTDTRQELGNTGEYFQTYSRVKSAYIPKTLGFLLIFMVVFCAAGRKETFSTGMFVYFMLMGILLMALTVIYSGAVEAGRTLFYYNIVFDMVSFVLMSRLFSWLWSRFRTLWKHRKGA